MNRTKEELRDAVKKVIDEGYRHIDYDRTVALARKYSDLVNGENLDKYLTIFARRENEEQWKQRLALTSENLSRSYEPVMQKFQRPGRLQDIKRGIEVSKNEGSNAVRNIQRMMDGFPFGGMETFLYDYFSKQGLTDPNSYVVVQYRGEGSDRRAYGLFYASEAVLDVERDDFNELEYVICRITRMMKASTKDWVKWYEYICYAGDITLQFIQYQTTTHGTYAGTLPTGGNDEEAFTAENGDIYKVYSYEPGFKAVEAVRLGYILDDKTDKRTCISPLHPSISTAIAAIRSQSNQDLSTLLHCFPQKIQRVPACDYQDQGTRMHCIDGKVGGETCPQCGGTGKKTITQPDETITVDLDFGVAGGENMAGLKLTDLVAYVRPDIETIRVTWDQTNELEGKIYRAVFSSEPNQIPNVTKEAATATEISVGRQDINDRLLNFGNGFSTAFKYMALLVADISVALPITRDDVIIIYDMPKDMKLMSQSELQDSLTKAMSSGASSFVIQALQDMIAEQIFVGNADAMHVYNVKSQFTPFLGQSREAVVTAIANNLVRREDAVAWANVDIIFGEIEAENPKFYSLDQKQQSKIFEDKLKQIIDKIEEEKPEPIGFSAFGSRTNPADPNQDPGNNPNNDQTPPPTGN